MPMAVSRGRLYQEELPIPTRRTKRPICHSRAIGKPKFNISSVIVFAWIFDFYAHASDKWDVSENQSGAGHRCKSRPNFRELRSSSRAPRLPNIFDRSADMPVVMMTRADRPASSRAKSALAIFKGDTRMYHRKES